MSDLKDDMPSPADAAQTAAADSSSIRIPRLRAAAHPPPAAVSSSAPSLRPIRRPEEHTAAVIATSDDAAVSKHSCVCAGYYRDPFVSEFISAPSRRSPLINRGYFSRVHAIHRALSEFLSLPLPRPERQVLSLGAGSDTTFFRMKAEGKTATRWVELDFEQAMDRKRGIISKSEQMQRLLAAGAEQAAGQRGWRQAAEAVWSWQDEYVLVGADMRDMEQVERRLQQAALDPSLPTFVLSECVLIYMKPEDSLRVIRWVSDYLTGGCIFLSYEQILPSDAFGLTMQSNLSQRGCPLLGLTAYPQLESHRARYLQQCGFDSWAGWDMRDVYDSYCDERERSRAEQLEPLDEFEEWNIIQQHYHISMAAKRRRAPAGTEAETEEQRQQWEALMRVGLLGAERRPKRRLQERAAVRGAKVMAEFGSAAAFGKGGEAKAAAAVNRYAPVITASPVLSPSDGSA